MTWNILPSILLAVGWLATPWLSTLPNCQDRSSSRIDEVVLHVHPGRLDEAREHYGRALPAPQPAEVIRFADTLKSCIENGPDKNAPETEVAPGETPDFSLRALTGRKGRDPHFSTSTASQAGHLITLFSRYGEYASGHE